MVVLASMLSWLGCSSSQNAPANALENDTITYFFFSEGGGMNRFSGFRYSIKETKEGQVHFLFNEGYPDEKEYTLDDHSVFDTLQKVILKHKVYKYSGYYEPMFDILDGQSWRLSVRYASGREINADGYMAGPNGYRDAFEELRQCLEPWKSMPVATNELVSFHYVYGHETYVLEKKDDHAELVYDNKETHEHKVLQRDLDMMESLRILLNIYGLKTNHSCGTLEEGYTLWMFEADYTNGEHYLYESYDGNFKCGYTEAIQGFIADWMQDTPPTRIRY